MNKRSGEENLLRTSGELFGAFSSVARQEIIELLAHRPQSVSEIAAQMPMTRSAVSQHLKILKNAGLVSETKQGRSAIYSIVQAALGRMLLYVGDLRNTLEAGDQLKASTSASIEPTKRGRRSGVRSSRADIEYDYIDGAMEQWSDSPNVIDSIVVAMNARLFVVGRMMGILYARMAAEYGINVGEAMVLGTLRRKGAPYQATPTELSRISIVTQSGIAKRLDRLEKSGHITRVENQSDGRSHNVQLSPKGRRVAEAITKKLANMSYAATSDLSEWDRWHMTDILRFLLKRFQIELSRNGVLPQLSSRLRVGGKSADRHSLPD